MAFSLKRPGEKTRHDDDGDTAPSFSSSSTSSTTNSQSSDKWFGRQTPPPLNGSGYSEFLDWASGGALEPSEQDRALAISVWSGKLKSGEHDDEHVSGMRM